MQTSPVRAEVPGLPAAIDVDATADYTRRVLAGHLRVPDPIAAQVRHIVHLASLA